MELVISRRHLDHDGLMEVTTASCSTGNWEAERKDSLLALERSRALGQLKHERLMRSCAGGETTG